ncbi:MAG TPA: pitrilysin family protein [Flavobacteriales bacterium]|nr:pitrilysin family protein [Flavobacteriales bacterium]
MRNAPLIIAAMLAAPAAAQTRAIAYTEFDLPNGLHVILHEDHSTPIVAVSVMYHVGSKNEDPTRRGFAHFFEHLLFEGSDNIERGEFSKLVETAGGVLNANTTGDRTYYYEVLPSNQLELGLWLESERMLHAKVDQKGVDTQREVVKEERRQRYENQPYGGLLIEVLKRAYTVHPYQWPTIGFMEDLNAASEADYKAFYKKFYVPNNAVLVLAGDIEPTKARELVSRYFTEIPRGGAVTQPTVVEPPLTVEVRDTIYDRIQLPAVVQAYRIPANGTPDFYAVDMVNRLLSGGNSARLNKALKDEQQKAVYVGAFSFPFEQPGLAIMFAIANSGVDATALENAMDAEVRRIQTEGVPAEELAKLKAQLETEAILDNSRVAGVAGNLATAYTILGNTGLVNTELDRYLALTSADLQKAANTYFTAKQRVVLHYLPLEQPKP